MRVQEPALLRARSGRPGDWQVWLRPSSGLPSSVCDEWKRRSLHTAPPEFLALVAWAKTISAARRTVQLLVEYLREHPEEGGSRISSVCVGPYVTLFGDASTSPRAQHLEAGGRPYSPGTITMYKGVIKAHVLTDSTFCTILMSSVTTEDLEAFFSRLLRKLGGPCRTHQTVWQILRMVFAQYTRDNNIVDPFARLDKPSY